MQSARYFRFRVDAGSLRRRFLDFARGLAPAPHKVRALLVQDGALRFEAAPLEGPEHEGPVKAVLAAAPVDSKDLFLYHKTTHRRVYERALAGRGGAEEVILWNEREEVTESCTANLVYELGGRRYTPPVECGLLPGTCRAELLARGEAEERVLPLRELSACEGIWLVNSVRGERAIRPLFCIRNFPIFPSGN